jgi:hypothetical protein
VKVPVRATDSNACNWTKFMPQILSMH